jgi:hypothetical protein
MMMNVMMSVFQMNMAIDTANDTISIEEVFRAIRIMVMTIPMVNRSWFFSIFLCLFNRCFVFLFLVNDLISYFPVYFILFVFLMFLKNLFIGNSSVNDIGRPLMHCFFLSFLFGFNLFLFLFHFGDDWVLSYFRLLFGLLYFFLNFLFLGLNGDVFDLFVVLLDVF